MDTCCFTRASVPVLIIGLLAQSLFWSDFWINPAHARYEDCSNPFKQPPDPDELVWLPYKTYCPPVQTMPSSPTYFLIDDYPNEDIEDCADQGTLRELADSPGPCYKEPASDISTDIVYQGDLVCNGNISPPEAKYYFRAHVEFYNQDFYSICPGYPTQIFSSTIAEKYFVQEPVGPDELIEEKNLGTPQCGLSAGNPINIATGNKYHHQVDATLPGGLEIIRHYNSQDSGLHAFGKGWRSIYSRKIDFTVSEDSSRASVTVTRDDGSVNYWRVIDSVPNGPPDAQGRLEITYDNEQILGFTYLVKGVEETYDHNGRLLAIVNDKGDHLQFSYANDLLVSVTNASGRGLDYFHTSDGLVQRISSSGGANWLFSYDQQVNLSSVEYPDGSVKTYHYGNTEFPNALTGETDERGNRSRSWAYDSSGRAILSTFGPVESAVERHTISYNADGTTTSSSPFQNQVNHSFKNTHGVAKFNSASGNCGECGNNNESVTYDSRGNRDIVTDFQGNSTDYDYDSDNLLQKVTHATGTAQQYEITHDWDTRLRKPTRTTRPGKSVTWTYNSRGQVLTRTETDGSTSESRVHSYNYFELPAIEALIGKMKSEDGPRVDLDDITQYEYYTEDHAGGEYRAGDLKAIVNPLGHRSDFLKYDGDGRLVEMSDANGVISTFEYDIRGRTSSISTAGKVTAFDRDSSGNLTRLTLPDESYISYEYDDFDRLIAIMDALGNRVEFTLDAEGNRISESSYDEMGALRRLLSRAYNSLGQLEMLIDGNGDETFYGYDSNGNLVSRLDANQSLTSFEYDSLDRLTISTNPSQGQTLMQYDDRDQLVSITDPLGNTTSYTFDGLGNQLELESPDTGMSSHEYDSAGNLLATTGADGVQQSYSYDALNRLTGISFPDSALNVSFSYDSGEYGAGRLTGMVDSAGMSSYSYDTRGNMIAETRTIGNKQYTTLYEFDSADRLTQITYPSGMEINFSLDVSGRIKAIEKMGDSGNEILASSVLYEPFGPAYSFDYGNGLAFSTGFDLESQVDSLQSGSHLNLSLEYDPAGNILAITDQLDNSNDQLFEYDDLNRLNSTLGSYGMETFAYDANGNRMSRQTESTVQGYSYEAQSNRLFTGNDRYFARDTRGNRTEALDANGYGHLYTYAEHNRLTQLSKREAAGDSVIMEYLYDGRGQRVSKSHDSESTHFIYDSSGLLLGEYSTATDGISREYIYLNGQPVAVITREVELITPPGKERVLDNGDPGTSMTGSWRTKSNDQSYGSDHLFANKASNRSYRWTAAPPGSDYQVYAWWADRKNQSSSVSYTIRYGNGATDTVNRSHSTGGGQWQMLGSYHSIDGQDYVEVSSSTGKFVADAMRWVEILQPVATTIETTNYIHFDHLGTPRQVTDQDQTLVWRWDSSPFGDILPDEDPDGDSVDFTLNLRFPGQYYDAESGLHYNYFRTYDPEIGRYIESDPIGLDGGMNSFGYVGMNPLIGIDPLGLVVVGSWIESPRLNLSSVGVDDWELVTPSWSWWGYAKFIRLYGHATGFINLDVTCSSECEDWEVHDKIFLEAEGTYDVGPNLYAIIIGLRAGPVAGVGANVTIGGAAILSAEHHYLSIANEKAGSIISSALALGPTGICLGSSQGR